MIKSKFEAAPGDNSTDIMSPGSWSRNQMEFTRLTHDCETYSATVTNCESAIAVKKKTVTPPPENVGFINV